MRIIYFPYSVVVFGLTTFANMFCKQQGAAQEIVSLLFLNPRLYFGKVTPVDACLKNDIYKSAEVQLK